MKTLRSYLGGHWVEGSGAPQTLVNPLPKKRLPRLRATASTSPRRWTTPAAKAGPRCAR